MSSQLWYDFSIDELKKYMVCYTEVDNSKPSAQRQPIQTVWRFTLFHLSQTLGAGKWHIGADQLGNLSYCLVALATAKSRFRFPEEQMRKFQEMNQELIQRYLRR